MNQLRAPLVTLLVCYLIFLGYVYFSYPALPDRVASHFDLQGRPDGWMDRTVLVDFTIAMAILIPGLILAIMFGVGWLPANLVNLPHRDYWLAPERRVATRGVLLRSGLWFCSLLVLFLTGMHGLVVQANKSGGSQHLDGNGIASAAITFLAATLIWSAVLFRYFQRRPPETPGA